MYEIPDSAHMIGQFLGKGETLSDKSRKPLSEGIIESFDMIGLPGFFTDCSMTISGNHFFIYIAKSQYRQRHIVGIHQAKRPTTDELIFGSYHR